MDNSFTASSPAASIIALSTIGEMHGTATLATPVPYPSPNAWPNQNYVLYCISPLRKVERRWSWTDGLWYPINSFEDHGGIVSDIQPGVGVTMSVPAPGWPLWEDLTVIGSDNQVYRRRWNGTQFLPWLSLGGGDLATGPTTTAFADGREGVFVVGKNGELYTFISELEQVPQSSDQWSLNMTAGSWEQVQPTTVRWGFNKLSVFLVARDGMLYYKEFTDSISGEIFNLGGVCTSRVAAVSWGSNNISVFVRGGDGGLWWTTLTGTAREWNSWESLSGSIQVQGEPETVSISFTSVKVFLFAWGTDGSVLYKMFDGESWTPSGGFDSLNLTLAGPPKASSKQEGELQLFGYSSDGRVLSKVYNETEGGWSSEVIDLGEI